MFAKVENGVTKSCQIFRRKNAGKTQFWPDFSATFLSRIACVVRESRHQRDRISEKNSEKRSKKLVQIFLIQKWACASRFQCGEFLFFWPRKN